MCSVLGMLGVARGAARRALRGQALARSARQGHGGPDWSGGYLHDHAVLVHERLAIVGVSSGAQPLRSADGGLVLTVNGEIYNHRELRREGGDRYDFQTDSDCEVINALYRQHGLDFLSRLNGIFAFALWDRDAQRYLIARDPIGVCPLYMGHDEKRRLYVASELKALIGICRDIEVFPPGHYLDSRVGTPVRYWTRAWRDYEKTRGVEVAPAKLRAAFESAVHRQLMSDVPYGVLLSGGLDSSLVAACAARFAKWCFLARVPTKSSEDIFIFTRRRLRGPSTMRPCARSTRCISMTATAPTRRWQHGAWRRACRFSTWNSSMWRCRWTPSISAQGRAGSRRPYCAKPLPALCRTAFCGGRRSSSAMASDTAGSIR